MKTLFINDKLVELGEDIYFPFTYKADDPTTIFSEHTKNVQIPRTINNDDVFNNIANITRINRQHAFNQIKKAEYRLYKDSKVVSKGIIKLENITDKHYDIILYDEFLSAVNKYEDIYLDEIDSSILFPVQARHHEIADYTNIFEVTPVFGLDEGSIVSKSAVKGNMITTSVPYNYERLELPTECTQMNLRHFVASDVRYSIPINQVLARVLTDSPYQVTQDAWNILRDYKMLTNKPKPTFERHTLAFNRNESLRTPQFPGIPWGAFFTTIDTILQRRTGYVHMPNGFYQTKIEYEFTFTEGAPRQNPDVMTEFNETLWYRNTTPTGAYIGHLEAFVYLRHRKQSDGTVLHETEPQRVLIEMLYNKNTTYVVHGTGLAQLVVSGTMYLNEEFTPQAYGRDPQYSELRITLNNLKDDDVTAIFNKGSGYSIQNNIFISMETESNKFYSGDFLQNAKLLPHISAKDFLVNIAKIFDLRLYVEEGILYLDRKFYEKSYRVLDVIEEKDLQVKTFDVSTVTLKHIEANTKTKDLYENTYGKAYAEQKINTGYTILNENEDVEIPYAIPFYEFDRNYFAYGRFNLNNSGGYSRYPVGNFTGLDDKLVIGYNKLIEEKLYLVNGEYDQGDILINNPMIGYAPEYPINYQWGINRWAYDYEKVSILNSFNTFIPHRFSTSGKITSTTELNKPEVNYAGIADVDYPESATFYNNYYKKRMFQKYHQDSHILTVDIYLDGKLDFYKYYNYKNVWYTIYEIEEYDPTTPGIYTVKLKKYIEYDG